MNRITGRSAFLTILQDEGITHLFGNPGTTELPIMHALAEHPDLNYVLGLQESTVVTMADGFSRASGQLVACNVHVAPGLGNAMGAIYNAKFTGTPMIITAGQQEQGHGLTEPMLYDPLVPIATPLVKWAVEVSRLEDLPRIIRRAAKVAMTPPTGPVFISLPGDILNDEAGVDLSQMTRVETRTRPSDALLDQLAERIMEAERPALLCGDELVKSDALNEAADLASIVGAAAYQQTVPYGAHFPSEHPCFMGTLTRSQKIVRDKLANHDLLVVLGADLLRMSVWSEIDPLPHDLPVIQVGQLDWEMGKNYATAMAVRADLKETLTALADRLRDMGGNTMQARARSRIDALSEKNWSARRATLSGQIDAAGPGSPMHPDWMILRLAEALPHDAIVVDEALTSSRSLCSLHPNRDRYSYHGLASGGIGWGIAGAVGVQIAQPDRPVCALIGDGSAMYNIQALWTAAHLKLPMTYVIANNGGYNILKQRLKSFHGNDKPIGMDFNDPPIDFVSIARGLGMDAERITDPDALKPALEASFASNKPCLLDVIVASQQG